MLLKLLSKVSVGSLLQLLLYANISLLRLYRINKNTWGYNKTLYFVIKKFTF